MFDWFWHLFDTSGFPARWHCGSGWAEEPLLGWLHIASDLATFAAYYAVPLIVIYYLFRRPDIKSKFPKIFWVFLALVFFSCGTVHLLEAGIFWWPHYRLSALFKVLTAIVSLIGVVVLARSLPRALDLKTPEQLQAEIDVRQRAEKKLDFERNLLHTLMNHLPDSIYFKDLSGKYLRVSRSLANNLQLTDASDAIGKSESDFLDRGEAFEAEDARVISTGEPIIGRVERAPWNGGQETWVSTSRLLLHDRHDRPQGTFGISHDITPLKRSEARMATLAQKLALPRGDDSNRKPLRFADFCLQDMITCGSDIRAMGLRQQSRADLERMLVEYLYRRMQISDGKPAFALVRMFETRAFSELDAELQQIALEAAKHRELKPETRCLVLRGTAGIDPSWNDPRRSRGHRVIPLPSVDSVEELPMIAQLIRQLGVDVGDVVEGSAKLMMEDIGTNVFHVEQAVGSEFLPSQEDFVVPYKIESVVGFGDVLPGGELFAVICFSQVPIPAHVAVLFSHLSISTKLALLATEPPGERVEAQIQAVDTLLQNYEHVVCDQENVLKRAMGELEDARDAADTANRAKSEFLANMSHEIRTPMNAIIGMTELVLEGNVSSTERDYLTTVLESGESLLNIINEILDFSKIEAGMLELDESEFEVREQIGDMVRSLAVRAHRKGIELACEIDSSVPTYAIADVARLRQIVVNLTGNAIKFTEEGEVVVRVDAPWVSKERADLRIHVEDTGIGIPPDKRKTIFDAFAQADTSTTRVHGGTGLGLAISANIARRMGGEIEVESRVGHGSRFTLALTVEVGTGATVKPRRRPSDLQGVAALLVDDNETNLKILEKMLEALGMRPSGVRSGQDGLEYLLNWDQQSASLPIVITDVHMPGMDGFEMIEHIRGNEQISGASVIILTSGANSRDAERCKQLNVVARIMKPVKQAEILEALIVAHGAAEPTEGEDELDGRVDHPAVKLHVLLVEDGIANQKLAIGMLGRWGHRVSVAENGAVAVEMYQREGYDLVLMDLQMPVMDGIEATKRIRQLEAESGSHVPIVAMTAHALVGDRERCIEAGMDHYVSKPIRKKDLAETVRMFFSSEQGGTSISMDDDSNEDLDTSDASAGESMINLDEALEMMEGDQDILNSVVEAFVVEAPGLLEQFDTTLESGDVAAALRAAHTLKGNFRILKLQDEQSVWEQIERSAREGRKDEMTAAAGKARQITTQALQQLKLFLEAHS